MKPCNDCGEEIGFVRLSSGRSAPVEDTEPEEYRVWMDYEQVKVALQKYQEFIHPLAQEHSFIKELRLVVDYEVIPTWQIVIKSTLEITRWTKLLDGPARVRGCEVHVC